jgi:hypothetical protein
MNRALISMLTMVRQKNLHLIIIAPNPFELERYLVLWRARYLINVYVGRGWQRGYFGFYNYDRKRDLYMKGKKTFDMNCVPPNFRGRFTNSYLVDEGEYRDRKLKAMVRKQKVGGLDRYKVQRDALVTFLVREGYSQNEIVEGIKGLAWKDLTPTLISMIVTDKRHKNHE